MARLALACVAGGIVSAPTSERRSCEENRGRDFAISRGSPPKLYFARAIPPATQASLAPDRVILSRGHCTLYVLYSWARHFTVS